MNRIATAALGVALLAATGSTWAAEPAAATLSGTSGYVSWTGSFAREHVLNPAPEVPCVLGQCDTFTLSTYVDGVVEVAIRWAYDGVTDLDLIVLDDDGDEVARSAGVDSNAESLFLENPPDGIYEIQIVPSNTFSPDASIPVFYEGKAEIVTLPTGTGDPLTPNLIATPPHNFHIATAANLIPFPENPLLSCYPEETIESEAHPTRCLRFDQTIANVGNGPLELRFLVDQALSPNPEDQRLVQRIYNDDGSHADRLADSYELHAVHGHVHYKGFGQSKLWPVDPETFERTGDPTPARIGNKVGFCVIDVTLMDEYWDEGAPTNGPRTWTFPTCNLPTEQNEEGVWMVQGISVGWADVYGWNLADQYIDITGLDSGIFELEQIANPTGSVLELDTTDNCASTIIRITEVMVTPLAFNESIPCSVPIPAAGT